MRVEVHSPFVSQNWLAHMAGHTYAPCCNRMLGTQMGGAAMQEAGRFWEHVVDISSMPGKSGERAWFEPGLNVN